MRFFSDPAEAAAWCERHPRTVLLDVNELTAKVGDDPYQRAAAAAACAAAARALHAAGLAVAVRGDDYERHWRHRIGMLLEESPRARRQLVGRDVVLRAWEAGDVPWLVEACQDPEIVRWTTVPSPYGAGAARSLVEQSERGRRMRTAAHFAITSPGDGERLGSVVLAFGQHDSAEVGYWVAEPARGRGVATAAVDLVADWGLGELGLARIELRTVVGNSASDRVAAKAGFEREGVLMAAERERDGGRVDVVSWSRTAPPGSGRSPDPAGTTPPGSA